MVEEVRKVSEEVLSEFCEELHQGDAEAMAALFTDGAILLPPNSEIVRGRQGIEKFWRAVLQGGTKELTSTIMESSGSGDTIHVVGNFVSKISQIGKKPVEVKGKYVTILKHTTSGWKVHGHIWNYNEPPQE
jgi:uncharacterized protein (TIGR02246 family)